MPTPSFKEILITLLKNDARLIDEQGDLRENLVHEYANELDPQLIELLLNDSQTLERFFLKIKDVYVFKQNDFRFFLDENKLDNSYTQFENKIGLSFGSRLLRETSDVVLNFPYKDCILEGGQSTEEGSDVYFEFDVKEGDYVEKKAKRKEVFFNQILARDEIDRLLEPKAFTNIKHFTKDGEEKLKGFTRDENGTIKDNLIIKGNNLLALHSLKQEFRGKVKLIYIDPPYNTGNDSFAYNDNFNHSTWFTFIKNRLEVAIELLSDEGLIIISCDDSEQAYLKLICDEIFKRENFIACLPTIMNLKGNNDQFGFAGTHEYTLVFAKNKKQVGIYEFEIEEEELDKWDEDEIGLFKKGAPLRATGEESKREDRQKMFYPILYKESTNEITTIAREDFDKIFTVQTGFDDNYLQVIKEKYMLKGFIFLLPMVDENTYGRWRWGYNSKNKLSTDVIISKNKNGYSINKKQRPELSDLPSKKPKTLFYKPEYSSGNGTAQLKHFFGGKIFKNPKPVDLIRDFVKISTKQDSIILDFHAGSGTTAHAVLQLNKEDGGNRQFIMVEQMSYAESITAKRVQKVLQKENIDSSFIYLELAKNNQNAIEQIGKAESLEALNAFFEEMCEKYFLHYNVKIKEFRERISKEGAFIKLPLARQKEIYAKMLDLNQLYVNVSDMQDSRYALSKEDISLTNDFYKNEL